MLNFCLIQLLPWSLGLIERVDVALSRTLFWYFGHALVYFWLLPAYMVWYVIIPKVIGGKIFSDSLARLSFMLFLLFSIPVGIHHQLTEHSIDGTWKFIQVVLTFAVIVPSLMTAFSMFAMFELRGRELGGKDYLVGLKITLEGCSFLRTIYRYGVIYSGVQAVLSMPLIK